MSTNGITITTTINLLRDYCKIYVAFYSDKFMPVFCHYIVKYTMMNSLSMHVYNTEKQNLCFCGFNDDFKTDFVRLTTNRFVLGCCSNS